jgi:hypothetical protein
MKITFTKNIYSNTTNAAAVEFEELHYFFVEKYQYDGHKENHLMFIMGELKTDILKDTISTAATTTSSACLHWYLTSIMV